MNTSTIIEIRVEDAIKHFGSAASLARALNIKPQAITSWKDFVPKLRAYELRDLHPELFKNNS